MKIFIIIYLIGIAFVSIVALLYFSLEEGKAMIKAYDDLMPISAELLYVIFAICWPIWIIGTIYAFTLGREDYEYSMDIIEKYKDE